MKRFDITYPIVATTGRSSATTASPAIPETFFVDRRGRVVPPHDRRASSSARATLDDGDPARPAHVRLLLAVLAALLLAR